LSVSPGGKERTREVLGRESEKGKRAPGRGERAFRCRRDWKKCGPAQDSFGEEKKKGRGKCKRIKGTPEGGKERKKKEKVVASLEKGCFTPLLDGSHSILGKKRKKRVASKREKK